MTSIFIWGKQYNLGQSTVIPMPGDNRLEQLSNQTAYRLDYAPFRSKKSRRLWRRFVSLQMKIAAKRRATEGLSR
jgi:hypothetical protein